MTHRELADDAHRTIRAVGRGDRIAPLAFPDVSLAVDEILGASCVPPLP